MKTTQIVMGQIGFQKDSFSVQFQDFARISLEKRQISPLLNVAADILQLFQI